MEKHRCKLCYRKFSNGRALGGHMKSHMMLLPVPPIPDSSLPSSSGSEPEEGEIVKGKIVGKLRNNLKLVDQELFNNVTLQDRESETESSKYVTRRRSKRSRNISSSISRFIHQQDSGNDNNNRNNISSSYYYDDVDQQQQIGSNSSNSSMSEVTSEEDVAFCLMMMSRDTWSDNGNGFGYGYEYGYGNNDDNNNNVRKRYKCDTCNKVFRSYQALGGHRASHKKTRFSILDHDHHDNVVVAVVNEEERVHKCPICFRVFASGQALGGHKRSHVIDTNNPIKSGKFVHQIPKMKMKTKIIVEKFIDLNLPAPIDDDDEEIVSHITTSTVSDVFISDQ